MRTLSNVHLKYTFIKIYKSFVWPHLDYGDIVYDQPNSDRFYQKVENMQYKTPPTISSDVRMFCNIHHSTGFELLTRLGLSLSHVATSFVTAFLTVLSLHVPAV